MIFHQRVAFKSNRLSTKLHARNMGARYILFKNGPFPASFSLFLSFQYSLQLTMFNIIFKWLDLNCGTLVSEATTLPTEPQPLPKSLCKIMTRLIYLIHSVII